VSYPICKEARAIEDEVDLLDSGDLVDRMADMIEELAAVLEPFAKQADNRKEMALGPDIDHWPIVQLNNKPITLGDLRRARAALAKARGE